MAKPHILIVEDEANIAEVLIAYCRNANFTVTHLAGGAEVEAFVKTNPVDLILLDLMLPDVDGISLCKSIRQFSQVPIIMVTAKNEEIDRLLGLELGADDYICKPFSPREVVARIKVVLRRLGPADQHKLQVAGFELDNACYSAQLHGRPLDLTAIEFKILAQLMARPNQVFSRQAIMDGLYTDADQVSDRNIDTHIKNIRKKITQVATHCRPIASVYGVGYKFEAK